MSRPAATLGSPRVKPVLPLFDLTRDWPELRAEALAVFEQIAATGAFTLGRELAAFEAEWAAYCGTRGAVGVSSGTAALELVLRALGAGPGRQVVTVTHTFVATVEAIGATGATPVLVDVDPATACIDADAALAAAASAPDAAAIVPVHLYGRLAAMAALGAAGLPLVEDAAQAHGAVAGGRRAGSLGVAGAFSFYPTKNLGAFGDGGAVTSDDEELLAAVRSLRHHGSADGDANRHVRADGGTARLDALQAALLRLKLRRLDAANADRAAAAARYRERLAGLPVDLPPAQAGSVDHLFVIELDDRDRVLTALRDAGIGAAVHYPTPVHLQPGWRHLGYAPGDFPHAERAARRCLSLPLFAGITEAEQERVAGALTAALGYL
jgi:dTDP-4-amino-4,6-dideoxygalactose transaminase